MVEIDLTCVEVSVIGNKDDVHIFRLSNSEGEDVINDQGTYEAEFLSHLGSPVDEIELDVTEIAEGVLIIPVTIITGMYRIRRADPRRTLLTVKVEAQ